MTTLDENREVAGPLGDETRQAGAEAAAEGAANRSPDSFYVPDLIQLEVGRGHRVVVVSDLHLAPTASEVSTNAADELAHGQNAIDDGQQLIALLSILSGEIDIGDLPFTRGHHSFIPSRRIRAPYRSRT